jgi:hypothetical protein
MVIILVLGLFMIGMVWALTLFWGPRFWAQGRSGEAQQEAKSCKSLLTKCVHDRGY